MNPFEVHAGDVRLVPLRRISPSRFQACKECPLREVYGASRADRLLPRAAAAHFGTAVHRLLAAAAHTQELELSALRAGQLLDSYVAEQEAKMADSAADQMLLPISDHLRDYEVRRRRAISAAMLLARSGTSRPSRPAERVAPRRVLGAEVWVSTADGIVGGYIDEVAPSDAGIVLRDYKTGLAATPGTAAEAAAWQQLKLYAALYAETTGQWPVTLEIVPLDGAVHAEVVSRDECRSLLSEARRLAEECNAILIAYAAFDAAMRLARPASETCRRCEYRPLCPAYRQLCSTGDENLPNDVFGTISARHSLGNGRLLFEVTDDARLRTLIRGITNDADRHPALPLLELGREVGFFNLAGDRTTRTFSETRTTVAVVYAA